MVDKERKIGTGSHCTFSLRRNQDLATGEKFANRVPAKYSVATLRCVPGFHNVRDSDRMASNVQQQILGSAQLADDEE